MNNARNARYRIVEAVKWLLLPVWLPAALLTYATGWIAVRCMPLAVWDWALDGKH